MSAVPATAGSSELVGGKDGLPLSGELPEVAGVYWRRRADARTLRRADRLWTLSTLAHVVPFLATAIGLPLLNPVTIPVAAIALAHAWFIPELYASRGAGAMRPPRRSSAQRRCAEAAETARSGCSATSSAIRRASCCRGPAWCWSAAIWACGSWDPPALCWFVRAAVACRPTACAPPATTCPLADRVAHLLLALRADESGFATVANLTFSGACWRVRRRVSPAVREGLAAAVAAARD